MQTTNKINIILGYDLGKSSLTTPTPGKIAAVSSEQTLISNAEESENNFFSN